MSAENKPQTKKWTTTESYFRCSARLHNEDPVCNRGIGKQGFCGKGDLETFGKSACPVAREFIQRKLTTVDTAPGFIIIKVSPDGTAVIGEKSNGLWVEVDKGEIKKHKNLL